MTLGLYSIYDRKAGSYQAPFQAPNRAVAQRIYEFMKSDEDHFISKFPDDFELWQVGGFDPEAGLLLPFDNGPVRVEAIHVQA